MLGNLRGIGARAVNARTCAQREKIAQAAWHRCISGMHRAKIVPEDLPAARKTETCLFFFAARLLNALGRKTATYSATIRYTCFHLFSSWNNQGHREIIMQITVMLADIPAVGGSTGPFLALLFFSLYVCSLISPIFALSHIRMHMIQC